jgi:broad specificity phosphatase PhoE
MLAARAFYYLRHGETDWNRERRIQGSSDIALNARGIAQAEAAREALRGVAIATICVSPLARARETARIVNQALARPIVVVDGLRECSFGPFEGTTDAAWFAAWRGGALAAGVEPYAAFLDRALAAINQALAEPGPVLIVGHAGVYWAVQRHGKLDTDQHLPNGVPLRHDPPTPEFPGWRAEPVRERAPSEGPL